MALRSTQPLTEMITRYIYWGKGGRCVRVTTLPPSCAVVMKSGNLNFLEPSGPLQACNGTALTLILFTSGGLCNITSSAAGRCGMVFHTALAALRTTLLILITSTSWSTLELRLLHMSQALPFGPCPTSHFSRAGVHKSGVPGRQGE